MIEILTIIVGIIISKFIGKHVLLIYYSLTNNEKAIQWIKNPPKQYEEYFGGGIVINVVGLITFCILFIGIFKLIDLIDRLIFQYG